MLRQRQHQEKMPVTESGQSPGQSPAVDQAPQEPDAFYAQEYFTTQGEIRLTEEGQAYLGAPTIRGWAKVAELQDARTTARVLSNDLAALAALTDWALSASDDAIFRQGYLCHPQLAATIRADRYDQELTFLDQLEAAVDTVDLAIAGALTRLRDAAGPRTRSGGAPDSQVTQAKEYQETLEEVRATLAKATLEYKQTRDEVREEQDAYEWYAMKHLYSGTSIPKYNYLKEGDSFETIVDHLERVERKFREAHRVALVRCNARERYEWYAMKYLYSGTSIPEYNYFKERDSFETIVDHLDRVERKFREADCVPVVRDGYHLTAEQKRNFVLDSLDIRTWRYVVRTLEAKRDVPLKWDTTRTVADLEDIWEFDLDSLTPPTVPRTPAEAKSFPELLIAIMPRGLHPLD